MTTIFASITTGFLSTATASRRVSLSGPAGHLKGVVKEGALAAQWARAATIADAPRRSMLLPRANHFFPGQLDPPQPALHGWLKEQQQ
jgi:hypothetical protein